MGARVGARERRCPFGGGFPGVVVGEGGVKWETLPCLGWIFIGLWPGSQKRRCLFGGGFPGAVVVEGGDAAHCGVDVSGCVACCSGETLSVRGQVSWRCGK